MSINIHETKEKDFEEISALFRDTNLRDSYFTKNKFRKMLDRNRGYCYVVEDQGKIVGSIFATHDGAFRGYIQKVVVATEYRRQSVASRLLETVIRKFEEAEIPLIFSHVEKNNRPSIELLKKLGFKVRDSHYLIDRCYKPR